MPGPEHALHTFMSQVTAEMASEYERIFSRSSEDPGTAGDEGEENWASLLRDWLPPEYHIATKGRLISTSGEMSPQIDVVVLKPFYPRKLREKRLWLAHGVAAVLECKNTLRLSHIVDSSDRVQRFKSLLPARKGSPLKELRSPLLYGLLSHSCRIGSSNSNRSSRIDNALMDAFAKAAHPAHTIDILCIADFGSWSNALITYFEGIHQSDQSLNDDAERELPNSQSWGVISSMIGASIEKGSQKDRFYPVGAMISHLTQKLAWNDAQIRDLADYYRLSDLWGNGFGLQYPWPKSVYSFEVQNQIESRLVNGDIWNEWSFMIA